MDPQLKQRLVGAAVLISLAILIVPMLLDGGYREAAAPRRDMAPMPPDQFEDEAPAVSAEVQSGLDAGLDANAQVNEDTATEAARAALDAPADEPAPLASSAPPAAPEVAPPQAPATVPATAGEGARPAPARAIPQPTKSEQWDVQLGSFVSRENAQALLGRVTASGSPGFILPLTEAGKTSYRVRAGPVSGRAAAEQLRAEIERKHEIQGMLVRHP